MQPNRVQFGATCPNISDFHQRTVYNHSNFSIDFSIIRHVEGAASARAEKKKAQLSTSEGQGEMVYPAK
jgi:hypothetical protein